MNKFKIEELVKADNKYNITLFQKADAFEIRAKKENLSFWRD